MGILLIKSFVRIFCFKKDTLNALKYSNEALLLARRIWCSQRCFSSLKQLSLLNQKRQVYNKEYIHINEDTKENAYVGEKSLCIEYETDQIKVENSDLTTQNRI
jgi:hypothetical protein